MNYHKVSLKEVNKYLVKALFLTTNGYGMSLMARPATHRRVTQLYYCKFTRGSLGSTFPGNVCSDLLLGAEIEI